MVTDRLIKAVMKAIPPKQSIGPDAFRDRYQQLPVGTRFRGVTDDHGWPLDGILRVSHGHGYAIVVLFENAPYQRAGLTHPLSDLREDAWVIPLTDDEATVLEAAFNLAGRVEPVDTDALTEGENT